MPDPLKLFDKINKANIPQRDRSLLLFMFTFMVTFPLLISSLTGLILANNLPDLVEWILKLLGVFSKIFLQDWGFVLSIPRKAGTSAIPVGRRLETSFHPLY